MDERLKQRLIGAIVLVALAVIFIPMILSGDREKSQPAFGNAIPKKPAVLKRLETEKAPEVPVPAQPAMVERQIVDKHTPSLKPEPAKSAPAPTSEPKTPLATAAKATVNPKATKAWVVQVGSFSSRKNALALSNKLRKHGYTAFVEAVKTNSRWTYRVRVGPEVRRSSAEAIQKTLHKKYKINGVVMGHP